MNLEKLEYPETRRDAVVDTLHGVAVPDPYRWLEDGGSAEVQAWMRAEDELARRFLATLPGRERLRARLQELLYLDAVTPPERFGDRYFYLRRHKDREKAILYWRQGASGEERVLIDPNALSADGSTALGVWAPSWDGRTLVYGLKANNSDETVLYVMDVESGRKSERDVIPGAKYAGPSWTPRGDGFYYTWVPPLSDVVTPAVRPGCAELRFHALGTDPASDAVVHAATGNPETFLGGYLSKDGHWLFAVVQHGWNATDVWYRDARSDDPTWRPFVVGRPFQYQVLAHRDAFYVATNEEAPRWRIFRVDPAAPERARWREIVPERDDTVIESTSLFGGHLVLRTMRNASSGLEVRAVDGTLVRQVPLPGLGTVGTVAGDEDDDEAYFSFESFTTPPRTYKTSITRGGAELFFEVQVPVDPSPYAVEQVWYASEDGTRVSMFLVHKKDLPKDGTTPFLLTGYGGFLVPMLPAFAPSLFAWLEAGGAYALPNLRGGGEYGEAWHQAGMRAHKQNVFDDFIGAAEWLVANGYTRPDKLAIRGGSNGGLLVGAALTQRPELFGAVICAVPLLDMIRYHLFGSGRTWIPEYGSAEEPTEFSWLHAYSPYHHVTRDTKYPALLMMSADSDDRVDPMHARKMTAALQWAQPAEARRSDARRPILLRIERHAGHGGADLVKQTVEQQADAYTFLRYALDATR